MCRGAGGQLRMRCSVIIRLKILLSTPVQRLERAFKPYLRLATRSLMHWAPTRRRRVRRHDVSHGRHKNVRWGAVSRTDVRTYSTPIGLTLIVYSIQLIVLTPARQVVQLVTITIRISVKYGTFHCSLLQSRRAESVGKQDPSGESRRAAGGLNPRRDTNSRKPTVGDFLRPRAVH